MAKPTEEWKKVQLKSVFFLQGCHEGVAENIRNLSFGSAGSQKSKITVWQDRFLRGGSKGVSVLGCPLTSGGC